METTTIEKSAAEILIDALDDFSRFLDTYIKELQTPQTKQQ